MTQLSVQTIKNNLVYQPDVLAQHQTIFPTLKFATLANGETYAAIPHTLDHAVVLNNLGYKAPSPIRLTYDWPGKYTPYAHQLETSDFLTLNKRAFCLSGMGSGKSMSVLWAEDYLMKIGKVRRALILSPLSTLQQVWAREIFANLPSRTYAVLHGSRQKRLDMLKTKADFYIINHDGVEVISEELLKREDIDMIIIDEVAVLRNQKTKRWKIVKAMVNRDVWCWGLTGTPTPNCPTDAYAQMKLIRPENYNGHFTKFKMTTMMQLGQFKWVPRKGTEEIIANVLKPSIRFATRDCIELPPTIYHDREAELSAEQKVHYKALERQAVTEIRGKEITAVNSAILISKLVQTACGCVYAGEEGKAEVDFGPRLAVLKEAIEEADAKIIVFVPFTGVLDALHRELSKHWSCEVVDGGTSSSKRNQIFDAFRSTDNPHIIIANPQTMAHGLTLTEADTIVWFAPVYSNEYYEQANARIVRPGQTKKTNIVHIAATAVERRIYAVLREKGALQGVILDLARDAK